MRTVFEFQSCYCQQQSEQATLLQRGKSSLSLISIVGRHQFGGVLGWKGVVFLVVRRYRGGILKGWWQQTSGVRAAGVRTPPPPPLPKRRTMCSHTHTHSIKTHANVQDCCYTNGGNSDLHAVAMFNGYGTSVNCAWKRTAEL
jgi:hypothetical protein